MTLHDLLDFHYGADGAVVLRRMLREGAGPNERRGWRGETPLHVAVRRRRIAPIPILLEFGADLDARTDGGKTAYAHAARRGFSDVVAVLASHGARALLDPVDSFAVAVIQHRLDEARAILAAHPRAARTGNPEEDRLLADVAGRESPEAVAFLIDAGADLTAAGLDSGTPLHQSAWFGQPLNARLLLNAGAPVEVSERTHRGTVLGWAVHGSRHSGDADKRQDAYVSVVRMLLDAGASLRYPDEAANAYYEMLLTDATPHVEPLLRAART